MAGPLSLYIKKALIIPLVRVRIIYRINSRD